MSTKRTLILNAGETRSAAPLGIFGDQMWIKLSGADTNGSYAILEGQTPPLGGPPLHRHEREDESFYVVEGEFVFEVDGERFHAGPGASVFAPKGTAHRFQNCGATPGRLLVIVQPAGLDAFFTDIDEAARGAREPDLDVVVPIFKKYGLELLGPPISAEADREGSLAA
jgi:mannose-6-phosphate isomerase-like protein (cupin superfamily)